MKRLIETHGGIVTTSISGVTNYLINGFKPGTNIPFLGKKLEMAREKKVVVIDEAALYELIIRNSNGFAIVFPAVPPPEAPAPTASPAGAPVGAMAAAAPAAGLNPTVVERGPKQRDLDLEDPGLDSPLSDSKLRQILEEGEESFIGAEAYPESDEIESGETADASRDASLAFEYAEGNQTPDYSMSDEEAGAYHEALLAAEFAAKPWRSTDVPPAAASARVSGLTEADARDTLGDSEMDHMFPSGPVFKDHQVPPHDFESTNPRASSIQPDRKVK